MSAGEFHIWIEIIGMHQTLWSLSFLLAFALLLNLAARRFETGYNPNKQRIPKRGISRQ